MKFAPHLTSPHLTSPHLTSPHLTSPHLTDKIVSQYPVITRFFYLSILVAVSLLCSFAHASNIVFYGGAGFSSNNADIATAYPYSYGIYNSSDKELKLNAFIRSKLVSIRNPNFQVSVEPSVNEGKVVLGFVVDRESISEEKIGESYKIVIDLSAQALFFDFNSRAILASYPIAIQYIDVSASPFSENIKSTLVEKLFYGGLENNVNIIDEFVRSMEKVKFSREVRQRIKVSKVNIEADAKTVLFPTQQEDAAKIFVAQQFSKFLSSNQSIPVLPFAVGQAISGKMITRLSGTEYNLSIPAPDYAIELILKPFKKIKFSENNVGVSWVYGAYLAVDVIEPDSNKSFLNATFKYGATKSIPIGQEVVDDRAAFQEVLLVLMANLTDAIDTADESWAKRYAGDPLVSIQMKKLNEVLKKCAM